MLSATLSIITKLGINQTAFIQFAIFGFTLFILSKFVFGPFAAVAKEREFKTKGAGDIAEEFQQKTVELHSEYQHKAREANSIVREIFEKEKAEAIKEYDKILSKAREEANSELHEKRRVILHSLHGALESVKSQSSGVAMAITTKLLGK